MNHSNFCACQNASSMVEHYFYKLMNNSSFGYDCRNKIGNCSFASIAGELDEITYLKKAKSFLMRKYQNLYLENY